MPRAGRRLRRLVREWLAGPEWPRLPPEVEAAPWSVQVGALLASLASPSLEARHRAAWSLGRLVAAAARQEPEAGREVLRRLVWGLNEESGAVAWGAAEAMAEVMCRCRPLADEFLNLLVSYAGHTPLTLDFPPLLAGAVWGLGRVAQAEGELVLARGGDQALLARLRHPRSQVRAAAAWAWGQGGLLAASPAAGRAGAALEELRGERDPVAVFHRRRLVSAPLGELAARSLSRAWD